MERTKKDSKLLTWKKTGGGSLHARIGGKVMIIKPGQIFEAESWEIPEAMRNVIKPVGEAARIVVEREADPENEVPSVPVAEVKYELFHRGGSWYNVLDVDGKVMNEKALKKPDAVALVETLESLEE